MPRGAKLVFKPRVSLRGKRGGAGPVFTGLRDVPGRLCDLGLGRGKKTWTSAKGEGGIGKWDVRKNVVRASGG